MLTKPISLETLKKNIITVKVVWKSDAKTDGEPTYVFEDVDRYYFRNGVLYTQSDMGRPSRYYDKRRADVVREINGYIKRPKYKGYYDGYGFGKGTFTITVTKRVNPDSATPAKKNTTSVKKGGMKKASAKKRTANKKSDSILRTLRRRFCE